MPPLALSTPVDALPWSIRTSLILDGLGCRQLGDVVQLSQQQLLAAPLSNRLVLGEVTNALRAAGLALSGSGSPQPAAAPDALRFTWGCLHTHGVELKRVRDAVTLVYQRAGLRPSKEPPPLPAEAPELNRTSRLGEDLVMIVREATPGWVAVMSSRWELAPPGRHPLASALSRHVAVLSISSVAGRFAELTRYEGGRAIQQSLAGPRKPRPAGKRAAPLDFAWFGDKGAAAPADELEKLAGDPDRFAALAGPDARGLRNALEAAPLSEWGPSSVVTFTRRRTSVRRR